MSGVLVLSETIATVQLLDLAEKDHVTILTGTGQTGLTTQGKHQGGTKTAVTGALAVMKKLNLKNVPTMTGATAGGLNAAKRSHEARPLLETNLSGGHVNAVERCSGMMLLCVIPVLTKTTTKR